MDDIIKILCSCGGRPKEVPQTEAENRLLGFPLGCNATALECPQCRTRFAIEFKPFVED